MDYTVQHAGSGCVSEFNRQAVNHPPRLIRTILRLALFCLPLLLCSSGITQDKVAPPLSYYARFNLYYDGDYLDALKGFQQESRSSIKTGTMRWIDSICFSTMMGECYYQMGVLDKALDCYTDALRIFVIYPDWMMRMKFDASLTPAAAGSRNIVPWGVARRPARVGYFRDKVLMSQGKSQAENERAYKQGGVIQQAFFFSISPQEIVRCTALAMRRRAEILGPMSKNDPLTIDVVSKVTGAIGPPNHWSEAWGDLERGLAYVAAGKESQAAPYLQRAVLAAGEFEHPLTCVALLELGRLKLLSGDYKSAANFLEESTYAAADFADYSTLEEAFRYLALTHLMSNQQGLCPMLQPALGWSKLRALRASLGISLAENLATLGQTRNAAAMLDEIRAGMGRRAMASGRIGARLGYVSAVVRFQDRKPAEGQKALADSLAYMKHGSLRLFHIKMVDAFYAVGGGRSEGSRMVMGLYDEVLRDPLPIDWALEPLESLAVLTTPHPLSYEHWFEAAIQRKEVLDQAMEIADRARRHRFFSSLALGGRLESLRWLLEAPAEWLDRQAALQRQELLNRYPEYAKLAEQSGKLRQELLAAPLKTEEKNAIHAQTTALAELATLASKQEMILREMAVRREPADMVFPPLRKTQDIKKALPEGHAVLAFFSTSRKTYAFLMNNTKYSSWEVAAPAILTKQINAMLRDMGHYSAVAELPVKDIAGEKWKTSAAKVLETMTKNSPADFSKSFKELAIVPDGALWYLPFEALQVTIDGQPQSLLSRFRIRYAPTLSLATPAYPPSRKGSGNAAVVWGKLPTREQETAITAAREKFEADISGVVPLKSPPAPSSIYSLLMNQLMVFDDLLFDEKDPYNWLPVPLDRNKPGSTMNDWLSLPWGHPTEIILTSFHTTAEDSLKRLGKNSIPGNDVFLNVCGLLSTGTRTILLSRWRTGGQSSYDLVREFVQELPHTSPSDAWQRAVLLTMDNRLNLEAEPRVKKLAGDEAPKAEHPFFWSGYMLFDSGEPVDPSKAATEEPVIKVKPPAVKPKPNPPVPPLMPGDNTKPAEKPKDERKPKEEEKTPEMPAEEKDA